MENNFPNIQVVVLAAGLSRRMGKLNKLLLPFKQHTILAEVLHQLSRTDINAVTIVLGHEEEKIRSILSPFDLNISVNSDYGMGQSSSIQSGVKALPGICDGFLICLGDMPTISTTHYQNLIDEFRKQLGQKKNLILRPYRNGQPGHPVCFAANYRKKILRVEEEDGCRTVIMENKQHLVKWETEEVAYFLDIDTEKEYRKEKA